jgi:hypothetical protein
MFDYFTNLKINKPKEGLKLDIVDSDMQMTDYQVEECFDRIKEADKFY